MAREQARRRPVPSTPAERRPAVQGGMGAVIQPPAPARTDYVYRGPGLKAEPRTQSSVPESGTPGETPVTTEEDRYSAMLESRRIQNATATMQSLMETYGLTSLYNKVVEYIQNGYDADSIMALIRTTPEYKQRFPAMEALAKKGAAISEGQYIEYESTARGLERRYGLPTGMLTGNVTRLLENEVSPDELNDRVLLAAEASLQAPDDIKQTLQQYYNVGSGGLTAYFLDPSVATPLLQKQYATAQIGAEALRQGVGIDVGIAQNLQDLGVTTERAREGFADVARMQGFTQGRGDVVTQGQLVTGVVGGNEAAIKEIERVARSRTAQFEGGGGFTQTERGTSGLGSAATR